MMSPSSDHTHRAVGAVVGAAVGDALGAPFEFKPPGTWSRRFPRPVLGGVGEMVGGGPWEPGEFTDDTQMAVLVARSLLETDGVDQADLEQRFKAWVASHPKDVGISTRAVLNAPGSSVEAASRYFDANPGGSAGNGSLMRTIGAAVHFADQDREATMDAARRISAVTHGYPVTGEGCAIYHELIRVALAGGDPLDALPDVLAAVPADQRPRYQEMLAPDWTPDRTGLPNGTVWTALAQAVWAVRHATSFQDAVVRALDLGDDADTVAAIAGGLAGAVWGPGAIPGRWAAYVHGTVIDTGYRLADLQDLARRLVGAAPAPLAADRPPIPPTEVAPGLWLSNLPGARQAPEHAAIVSLCRPKGYFDHRRLRREIFLVDQEDANPEIESVLDDIVATIAAFEAEGTDVVVHCHGGRSRTGLALRAWLIYREGLTEPEATREAQRRWPRTLTWNESFTEALQRWKA